MRVYGLIRTLSVSGERSFFHKAIRVYLFGSRARGSSRAASDIDVGILDDAPLADGLLSDIRETLFESTIPYRVDVVDLGQVDAEFRRRVLTEGILWKD